MGGFLSFACCFALLLWLWHEHNMFFRRYGLQDGVTVCSTARCSSWCCSTSTR